MGVDAEMFVRIKGRENWLDEAAVRRAAGDLAATLGHDNFFISRPGAASAALGTRHALSIVPRAAEVLREYDYDDEDLKAADPNAPAWSQDGPWIFGSADEQFIKVHLWGRYYGPGYERGNWPNLRMTACWLATRFRTEEVYYGGDSSGICAEQLFPDRIEEIDLHFLEHGHEPYRSYFGHGEAKLYCDFCDRAMNYSGGGRDRSFFYCDGCGLKSVVCTGKRYDLPSSKAGGGEFGFFDFDPATFGAAAPTGSSPTEAQ